MCLQHHSCFSVDHTYNSVQSKDRFIFDVVDAVRVRVLEVDDVVLVLVVVMVELECVMDEVVVHVLVLVGVSVNEMVELV